MADALLGRVIWYELMTTDVAAAKSFYSTVIGWTTVPFKGIQGGYDVWMRADNAGIGGVMPIPPGMNAPPHWGMYVGVPNLDDLVAQVEARGGSALSPVIEVPEVGRMRTMRDPQGAAFSMLQPYPEGSRAEREPEVGEVSWHELFTTDAEAAVTFYDQLFGWRPTEALDMGPMGKYHMFARGVGFGGGMMNIPKEMGQMPPHWTFYVRVPDVHEAVKRVKDNGGQVLNGPMEVPGGDWAVTCMDPQGAAFGMHHTKKR